VQHEYFLQVLWCGASLVVVQHLLGCARFVGRNLKVELSLKTTLRFDET
jgi:hypothetical protein